VRVLAIIDWPVMGKLVAGSLVGGIGLVLAYSLLIMGITRAWERSRNGNAVAAGLYGALAVLAGATFVGGIAFGISIIISKD
jgi:ABC-type transport system involved in multi-copper enzyme maturation permease subunit